MPAGETPDEQVPDTPAGTPAGETPGGATPDVGRAEPTGPAAVGSGEPAAVPSLVVSVPPVSYVAAGVAATVPVTVRSGAGSRGVTVVVDSSELAGIATVAPADAGSGCRPRAAVLRCPVADVPGGTAVVGRFVVRPLPRAAVGAVGRLAVTVVGAEPGGAEPAGAEPAEPARAAAEPAEREPAEPERAAAEPAAVRAAGAEQAAAGPAVAEPVHTTVRVVPAVALAGAGPATTTYARRPGGEFAPPLRVRNAGATVLRGADLVFPAGPYHRVADRYGNCRYDMRTVRCHFAGDLLPGTTYALNEPLRLRVRPDFPAPGTIGPLTFEWHLPAPATEEPRGAQLRLVPVAGTAERAPRSRVTVRVTGTRTADLRALGGEVTGDVGATVTAVVGMRNVGTVFLRGDQGAPAVVAVTPPPGTTVRAVPRGCAVADRDRRIYHCVPAGLELFEPGDTVTWRFRLRIDRADERSGWVGVRASHEEPLLADNLAPLTVTTASGAGGGTAMAASLPVTGPPVAALTAIGLLFVAAGVAMCRLSRP